MLNLIAQFLVKRSAYIIAGSYFFYFLLLSVSFKAEHKIYYIFILIVTLIPLTYLFIYYIIDKFILLKHNINTKHNHKESRYYTTKKLNLLKLTESISNEEIKKDVTYILSRSIIENNIIFELNHLKRNDLVRILISLIEEKSTLFPRNKSSKINDNTQFALNIYNNALDMANEIIILSKASILPIQRTIETNRKKKSFEWETFDPSITNKIPTIEKNINELFNSITLLKDTFSRLKTVDTLDLEFKEGSSLKQSINELKNHTKGQ